MSITKAGKLPSRIINKKRMRPYPVPPAYMLGALVCKQFGGKWYKGSIDNAHQDEDKLCWHVTYSDFDEEDLEAAVVLYHPLLDHAGGFEVPEPGYYVWFAKDNLPVLDRVVSVDVTLPRPLVVKLHKPVRDSTTVVNEEGNPILM